MTVLEDLDRDVRLGGLTVWGTYDTGRPGPFIETDAFGDAYADGERYGTPEPRLVDGGGAWVCGDAVVCPIGRPHEHELF